MRRKLMRRKLIAGAAAGATALFLAACGGGYSNGDNSNGNGNGNGNGLIQPPTGAVSLSLIDDARRELGNVSTGVILSSLNNGAVAAANASTAAHGFAMARSAGGLAGWSAQARAEQVPHASTGCPGGGTDTVTASGSGTRGFVFFNFSGAVNYQVHSYSNCAGVVAGVILNGPLENGATSDQAYSYVLQGNGNSGTPVNLSFTTTDSGNGQTIYVNQNTLGTIETNASSSQQDLRAGLLARLTQTEQNTRIYDGAFALGSGNNSFEVFNTSGSQSLFGPYFYASSFAGCGGGGVSADTPVALQFGNTSFANNVPVGGTLVLSSGRNSVTYSFNQDGSATLSGSVNGTLTSSEVANLWLNGSC